MKKIFIIVLTITFLVSCGNAYKLKLTSPKTVKVNQKLTVSVSDQNNNPIDSVRYYLDGKRLSSDIDINISDKKLGLHAISATIFYGDKQKKLTNTIHFYGDKAPDIYTYEVINEFPHDKNAFTQGFEYHNGFLYESTGQRGESSLRKVELKTGKILQKIEIDKQYFGEGMTIFNNKIYLLTWQGKKGFVFNLETFEKENEFKYNLSKEGWGLSHNENKLLKTDGSERVWFLNPETLTEDSFIEAYTDKRKVSSLNEIEYINGKIYANKWQQNSILIINSITGAIEGIANLKGLQTKAGQKDDDNVLNGIAYDAKNERLFVTGKKWDKVFELKLLKKQN
jgi:glutamine cyclotransferase